MLISLKIARGRLYMKTAWMINALFKLPFSRLKRGNPTFLLERKLGEYFGVTYCRTLSSCRMSLYYLLKSLNLKKGDEILLTPINVPDIVNAIHILGFRPVFVDMVPEAHNIDLKDLEKKITDKSRVLFLTYLSGYVPDMDKIIAAVTKHNLILIEDITQNYGATYKQKMLGTFGVASVGSFSPSKTMSSLGGGFMITNDQRVSQRMSRYCDNELKSPGRTYLLLHIFFSTAVNVLTSTTVFSCVSYYGARIKWYAESTRRKSNKILSEGKLAYKLPGGYNFNPLVLRDEMPNDAFTFLADIQSNIALKTLYTVEDGNEKRRRLAAVLSFLLDNKADRFNVYQSTPEECRDVFWHYAIEVPQAIRSDFQHFLLKRGIDTTGYELRLCSHEPVFEVYYDETPGARKIYESAVFLPIHPSFSEKQVARVARTVNQYFKPDCKECHVSVGG